jgi:hypothetical protein
MNLSKFLNVFEISRPYLARSGRNPILSQQRGRVGEEMNKPPVENFIYSSNFCSEEVTYDVTKVLIEVCIRVICKVS